MGIRKPVIGVPVNVLVEKSGAFPGTERAYVNQDYLKALKLAGAMPLVLPIAHEREDIQAQLALLDGLLFPGGADVSPLLYGEEPVPELEDVFPELDDHQIALAHMGRERGIPMLGICRGMQVLNVAFGGTLHQHLESGTLQHVQKTQRHVAGHSVDLAEDGLLARIFGRSSIGTNSFHHQAVKDLAPGFEVNARARDGVIEGFERTDGSFILGVQWHPEGMVEKHPLMLGVFRELVYACHQEKVKSA